MYIEETSRLSRLTAIITQLQSKRLITAREIADKFDISIRTVYRDIRALESAGIPVYTEEGKGYSLLENFKLSPLAFTESEANALVTAEQLIAKSKDASLVQHYNTAITKIKATMRYHEKDKAELLSQRIVYRQNAEMDITSEYLSTLQLSITNLLLAQIRYQSLQSDEITERTIEPFAMYNTSENWVLIAFCRLRKDFRAFRLDRIRELQLLDDKFEAQKITLQDYFDICREKTMNP